MAGLTLLLTHCRLIHAKILNCCFIIRVRIIRRQVPTHITMVGRQSNPHPPILLPTTTTPVVVGHHQLLVAAQRKQTV